MIASGATLSIDTAANEVFLSSGRTLRIDSGATASWSGQSGIFLGGTATIENAGTFNADGGGQISGFFAINPLIHNAATGTFRKSAGPGTLTVGVPFDNDGTVEAAAGTLSLEGGDAGTTTGDFNGSGADGLVRFTAGTYTLETDVSLNGRIELTNATLTVSGTVPVPAGATFTQSGGTLGGAGTLTVSGSFNWSGGTQTDAGTTVIASGATLSIDTAANEVFLSSGRTLRIDSGATASWSGQSGIFLGGTATIENAGTFNADGGGQISGFFAINPLIHNAATGTFRKSAGPGTLTVGVPFDNDGTVEAAAGTLSLEGGDAGTTTGDFNGSGADGLVRFTAGTYTLETDVSLNGRIELTNATLTVSGTVPVPAGATFTQSGGTLGGAGTLTVSGSFNWSGGTQTDAGTTVIASGATLSIDTAANEVFLSSGRTLRIDSGATASWSGQSGIFLGGTATIENAGTFNADGGGQISGFFAINPLIHNAATGTFRKSAGPGTLTVGVPFDNDGTVEAAAGTLSLEGGDAGTTTGDFNGSGADGLVRFTAGTYTLETDVSLNGRIELTNATLTVSGTVPVPAGATFTQSGGTLGGAGTLTVSGSFNWSGGTQTDAGTTVIASGATLSIDTAANEVFLSSGRTLRIDSGATASWSGQSGIFLGGTATIENAGTFNADGGGQISGFFAINPLIHNAATGTFRKSAGPGTLTVGVPFDNDGTVEIATGILGAASYTQSATGTLQVRIAGTAPGTGFGQLHVDGTAALAGTLRIVTASGFTPAEGNSFRIVDAGSRTGVFSTVEGATTDGVEYSVQYDATGVTLVVGTVPPASEISISDASATEGGAVQFTVSLSAPQAASVTVDYATANGSAVAPGDYTAGTGTVTFAPGDTSETVSVQTNDDALAEGAETFNVNLSNATGNATIADGTGVGTINDNDAGGSSISIDNVTQAEGNSGQTAFQFTVSLDAPSANPVTVDYATADFSATSPGDYTAGTGTVTFAPGDTSETVTVQVNGDTAAEPDETFNVNLSNATGNAAILDAQGVGTITNDDVAASEISIAGASNGESGQLDFLVSMNNPQAAPVTVDFATADGTAVAPGDYTPATGTVTFAPGDRFEFVTVQTIDDALVEDTETFDVNLSNATGNATIATGLGVGVGQIIDNDVAQISIINSAATEGGAVDFTVSLSAPQAGTVTVDYATSDGTATAPGRLHGGHRNGDLRPRRHLRDGDGADHRRRPGRGHGAVRREPLERHRQRGDQRRPRLRVHRRQRRRSDLDRQRLRGRGQQRAEPVRSSRSRSTRPRRTRSRSTSRPPTARRPPPATTRRPPER